MAQYVDDVTKDDVKAISAKLKRDRLGDQEPRGEVHIPYPCDEHRHFKCGRCGTVHCGGEYTERPFKGEPISHIRWCHNCQEKITFYRTIPFWRYL